MGKKLGEVGTNLLFENQYVKVWKLVLEGKQATPWHQHLMDYLYVVTENSKVRTEYEDGTYEDQDDEVGKVVMRKRDPIHRLVNLGNSRYTNIVIELKGSK